MHEHSLFGQRTQVRAWLIDALVFRAENEEGRQECDGQQHDRNQCREHAGEGIGRRRRRRVLVNHKDQLMHINMRIVHRNNVIAAVRTLGTNAAWTAMLKCDEGRPCHVRHCRRGTEVAESNGQQEVKILCTSRDTLIDANMGLLMVFM